MAEHYGAMMSARQACRSTSANLATFGVKTRRKTMSEITAMFLYARLGGPVNYRGRDMNISHEGLGIVERPRHQERRGGQA
jgi:hypothetical protein